MENIELQLLFFDFDTEQNRVRIVSMNFYFLERDLVRKQKSISSLVLCF